MSYGRLLPKPALPKCYSITQHLTSGLTTTVQIDSSLLITASHATGIHTKMDLKPRFAMENDGLLHLSGMSIDDRVGESRTLVECSMDYPRIGSFYVPLHVTMSMPGALSFTHTFSNCQVFDKNNAPQPSAPDMPTSRPE